MLKIFKISDAARQELLALRSDKGGNAFVPTLYWAHSVTIGSSGKVTASNGEMLCVGQYSRAKLDAVGATTAEVDGVEIVIESWWHDRLEGKTLDFAEGKFVLIDSGTEQSGTAP
jgi:hypothetical protein